MFNQTEFMKKYLALALDNLNGAKNGSYNFTEEEIDQARFSLSVNTANSINKEKVKLNIRKKSSGDKEKFKCNIDWPICRYDKGAIYCNDVMFCLVLQRKQKKVFKKYINHYK